MKPREKQGPSRLTGNLVILLALLSSVAATSASIDVTVGDRHGTHGSSGVWGRRRYGASKRNRGRGAAASAAFVRAPIGVVVGGGGDTRELPSSSSLPEPRTSAARPPQRQPGGPSSPRFNAARPPHAWPPCGAIAATTTATRAHRLGLVVPPFLRNWGGSSSLIMGYLYLSLASAVGMVFERLPLPGGAAGDWGIIVTMAAAATMSNVGAAPSVHPAYETCWTRVLPMSLALLLLPSSSAPSPSPSSEPTMSPTETTAEDDSSAGAPSDDDGEGGRRSLETILAVSVPFAVGCIGSVLGCAASFLLLSSSSPPPHLRGWKMDPSDAALAAGCLCSSYVGGTFNFFQTARILLGVGGGGADLGGGSGGIGGLFGAMAGADLIVMAVYFAALAAFRSSATMWSWFPGRRGVASPSTAEAVMTEGDYELVRYRDGTETDDASVISSPTETATVAKSDAGSPSANEDPPLPGSIAGAGTLPGCGPSVSYAASRRWTGTAPSIALALALSWIIVDASDAVERRILSADLPLHGVGCAFIALLSTAASVLLGRGASRKEGSWTTRVSRRLDAVSPALSSACFHLLFASMGFSANLAEAVVVRGPACLAFASLALVVHVAVTIGGTAALSWVLLPHRWRRWSFGRHRRVRVLPVGWDEVMVASNAAIGGPATAAAFAGTFKRRASAAGGDGDVDVDVAGGVVDGDRTNRGLILAATVWGVVGYAVGTGVGVALTGSLTRFT